MPIFSPTWIVALLIGSIIAPLFMHTWTRTRRNSQRLPYFPGPKTRPIIGNLLDLPKSEEWLKAQGFELKYGPRIFLQPFPGLAEPLLILNSLSDVVELMEKRSALYSSRPTAVMMCELQSWDWLPSNMSVGPVHRAHRAYLHKFLGPSEVGCVADTQQALVVKLLSRLLDVYEMEEQDSLSTGKLSRGGQEFSALVRWMTAAGIMRIAYGHDVESTEDNFVELAEHGVATLAEAAAAGRWIVDTLPWLKYLPEWFPGASFQKTAHVGRKLATRMKFEPYELSKEKVLLGNAKPSMIRSFIEANLKDDGGVDDESTIAGALGVAYVGGADTSISTVQTFFLAMLLNPSIQRKAQAELDTVIGKYERLPTKEDVGDFEFGDHDANGDDERGIAETAPKSNTKLRYLRAIVLECLRWHPVTPMGAPHALTQDDIYDGHFIPANTIIIANIWAILHDPSMFPDPNTFDPGRWLKPVEKGQKNPIHPMKAAFGFGRRICPGRFLAYNSVFLTIASILAVFDILPALDEHGKPLMPKEEYVSTGIISRPAPFACRLVPRSQKAVELIREDAEVAQMMLRDG